MSEWRAGPTNLESAEPAAPKFVNLLMNEGGDPYTPPGSLAVRSFATVVVTSQSNSCSFLPVSPKRAPR